MNPWKGTGAYQRFMAGVCARLGWANIADMKERDNKLIIEMKNGDVHEVTVIKTIKGNEKTNI